MSEHLPCPRCDHAVRVTPGEPAMCPVCGATVREVPGDE